MKHKSIYIAITLLMLGNLTGYSESVDIPDKESFHIFLLAGQSNMAGRGKIEDQDKVPHSRLLSLDKSKSWIPAIAPIHFDKSVAGICLAQTFGLALLASDKDITIGLVPCACGGSPISTWTPDAYWKQTKSNPYDDAMERTKHALKSGVLKGILWHQGESDCKPELAKVYEKELINVIRRFRKDLDAPDVPFIIGQMGMFKENPWTAEKSIVDQAHKSIAAKMKNVYFVSAEGLTCKNDHIHFNAPSLREFGRRYAEAYLNRR